METLWLTFYRIYLCGKIFYSHKWYVFCINTHLVFCCSSVFMRELICLLSRNVKFTREQWTSDKIGDQQWFVLQIDWIYINGIRKEKQSQCVFITNVFHCFAFKWSHILLIKDEFVILKFSVLLFPLSVGCGGKRSR